MIEAVGDNFLITYFSKINEVLKRDGLLALQAIISPDSRYHQIKKDVDWIQKHIFPGGLIPSVGIINKSIKIEIKFFIRRRFIVLSFFNSSIFIFKLILIRTVFLYRLKIPF